VRPTTSVLTSRAPGARAEATSRTSLDPLPKWRRAAPTASAACRLRGAAQEPARGDVCRRATALPRADERSDRLACGVGLDSSALPGGRRIGRVASADPQRHHDHILRPGPRGPDRGRNRGQGQARGTLRQVRSPLDRDARWCRAARTASAEGASGTSAEGRRGQDGSSEADGQEEAEQSSRPKALGPPLAARKRIVTSATLFVLSATALSELPPASRIPAPLSWV